MTKEREYRAYAGTCVDLANKANNDEDKKHLLGGPFEALSFCTGGGPIAAARTLSRPKTCAKENHRRHTAAECRHC